jgi:hypothetical protein
MTRVGHTPDWCYRRQKVNGVTGLKELAVTQRQQDGAVPRECRSEQVQEERASSAFVNCEF